MGTRDSSQLVTDLTAAVVHSVDVKIGQSAFDSPYERRRGIRECTRAMTKAHSQREPAGADEALAILIPGTEAVIRQERVPYGLFVPDLP
jgi:hypothetical protein